MVPAGVFVLVPLVGYAGLWILGIILFLIYFRLYRVHLDTRHAAGMLRKLPAPLAIATVPVCSFLSFFVVAHVFGGGLAAGELLRVGLVAFVVTVVLDLLITVAGEKINILAFPVNLMYLFAWLVIVPAVLLAGR